MDKETISDAIGELMSTLGRFTEEESLWILEQTKLQYLGIETK